MQQSSLTSPRPLLTCVLTLLVLIGAVTWAANGRVMRREKAADASAAALDTRLFINFASEAELALLPRIGPALAARIIAARLQAGPFRSPADLAKVRGIGPKTVIEIEPMIRFD